MKTLHEIENFLTLNNSAENLALTHLYIDSRDVSAGSVFIALQGSQGHGLDYLQQVVQQGAMLVLTDKMVDVEVEVRVVFVENLTEKLAKFARWFYDNPSQSLKIVGITGTNGKTSVAHYVAQICHQQFKTAVLGTLGNGVFGSLKVSANTTLHCVSLQRQLAEFRVQNVVVVLMEVSSHAIKLGRIEGLNFEVLALTQVTRDHLDFHGTVENYRATKKQLFSDYPAKNWVVNADDLVGSELLAMNPKKVLVKSYGKIADYSAKEIDYSPNGLQFKLNAKLVKTSLFGDFNIENILCAFAICRGLSLDELFILQALNHLTPVAGRMEVVAKQPTIIIDYAHTDAALKSVLLAVKQHLSDAEQRLFVVFGCGGNRDLGKRALMGKVASDFADEVILTDDNPRFESPSKIMDDILSGLNSSAVILNCIHHRAEAILLAVQRAKAEDIIVLAGKGHEDYQEIKGVKYPMSDFELVKKALKK